MVFTGYATGSDTRRLRLKAAPTQVETSASVLTEIFTLWDSRASFYGDFLFASVLAKTTDGVWKNVFTYFKPLHKAESPRTLSYDYRNFIIAQGCCSLQVAKTTLMRVRRSADTRARKACRDGHCGRGKRQAVSSERERFLPADAGYQQADDPLRTGRVLPI